MLSSRFRGVNSVYYLHRRPALHKSLKANLLHSLRSLSASLGREYHGFRYWRCP